MKPNIKYLIPMILIILMLPVTGIDSVQAQGAAQAAIQAEVDRTALTTDETLLLTVTLHSSSLLDAPRPSLPVLTGFNVVGSSSSSQISIVNGDVTSVVVYSYRLQPYETGDLEIEPISVTIGGQTHSTEPITVHVSQGTGAPAPAPAPSSRQPASPPATTSMELAGQDLFVEAAVDNPTPYVGQQVVYTFRFYEASNLWGQPGYEAPTFTGFWSEPQRDQQEYQVQAAGRIYRVTEVRTILFPSVVGPVTIDPARLTIPGGLFRAGQTLQTKPVELNVQPLPPGAPSGFDGAVGQFNLTATVEPTLGKVDEPLTWQVTLSGRGNVSIAPDPVWPEIDGWRSFESQATVHSEIRDGQVVGSRTYERLLVPSLEGESVIPSLEYVYFDPSTGQYHSVRSEPISVSITPGATGAPPATAPPRPGQKETVEQLADDIHHLKAVPSSLGVVEEPVTASGLYWAAWAFPVLGAAGYFAWQRRQRYWEKNLGLARSSQARKKARRALAQARRRKGDAYGATGQILTDYLADKLDRPVAGLTHQALAELLVEQGASPDLAERVEVLLVTSELGRFAPGADDPDHARSLLQEMDILIVAVERVL
jgi:hypothetical protein